jgi:hypothetical protein
MQENTFIIEAYFRFAINHIWNFDAQSNLKKSVRQCQKCDIDHHFFFFNLTVDFAVWVMLVERHIVFLQG